MNENKKTITDGKDTFELVDYVPSGYEIWNIGKNMINGYLPLCRLSQSQPFEGGRNIEADTLKAIKIEGAQTVLAAVGYGLATVEEMERYINSHSNAKKGSLAYERAQRMKAALPIMKQIKWQ